MKKTEDEETGTGVSVSVTSISTSQESLSPPPYRTTWGNDTVHDDSQRQRGTTPGWKSAWSWTLQDRCITVYRCTVRMMRFLLEFITHSPCLVLRIVQTSLGCFMKIPIAKKQFVALFMVITCGIAPFFVLAYYTTALGPFRPFYRVFSDKMLGCGDVLGNPQNATISGIEKVFVLDNTFGRFSFSQVKTIDVFWDLLVGRGVQMLAWWASYIVFSDALLRVIERHPASFRIFQRIALEGPSLLSLWTLLKELWCAKNRKTKALFCYMWISTAYVLCIPVFLGAATGYDSTNVAWLDMDDTNNIVPWSSMQTAWLITGTKNETFVQTVCKPYELQFEWSLQESRKYGQCDCQLENGTVINSRYTVSQGSCTFDFPGNTQTFDDFAWSASRERKNCNSTFTIEIHGKNYAAKDLKTTWGYCFNDIGYNSTYLYDKTRCLPDTANPAYEWGFATMLAGLFVFLQFGWSLSMYAVWQDAQVNCALVKGGYRMTPLRAAFAMTKAARRKTGMGEKDLMRADTKELEKELYGGKKTETTQVDHGIFSENAEDDRAGRPNSWEEELRSRHQRGLSEAALG